MAAMKLTNLVVVLALVCLALLMVQSIATSIPNCYQPPSPGGSKPPSKPHKPGHKKPPPKTPSPSPKPPTKKPPSPAPTTKPPSPVPTKPPSPVPIKPPSTIPPTPKPPMRHHPKPPAPTVPYTPPTPTVPVTPAPSVPTPTPSIPTPSVPVPPTPVVPVTPVPPVILPTPPPPATCPVDIVKLGVCVPILGGILGNPLQSDCCALLGIIGLDVEVCLCAAIDANVLGIINVHISKLDVIASIITTCGQKVPPNLSCP